MNMEETLNFISSIVKNPEIPDLSLRQMAVFLATNGGAKEYEDPQTGGFTVRSLAAGLRIAKPAITRAADRLEEEGLIRRIPVPEDRRLVKMTSTIHGQAMLTRMFGASPNARSAA